MRLVAALVMLLLAAPANAQPQMPYTAPDQELWSVMVKSLDDLPMSMAAHMAMRQLLDGIQQEARKRQAMEMVRRKAADDQQKAADEQAAKDHAAREAAKEKAKANEGQ